MLKMNQNAVQDLLETNQEFKELFDEHVKLEQDLEALYSLKYIPPEVEKKIKAIKKTKLRGKDRMEQILSEYKKSR